MSSAKRGGRKKFGHKGGNRHFSSFDELKRQDETIRKEKALREERGSESETEDQQGTPGGADAKVASTTSKATKAEDSKDGSSSDESSEDDDNQRRKGVQGLIEIENPNRVQQRQKKVTELEADAAPQLSRREKEAMEKERAKQEFERLHAEGKTDQARADLARLAVIRKQREEAAKQREADKLKKDQEDTQRLAKDVEQRARLGPKPVEGATGAGPKAPGKK